MTGSSYDGLGRLVAQNNNGVLTLFYYAGAQRIEERDFGNRLSYLYFFDAPGSDRVLCRQDSGGERLWYQYDLLGNTTHLSNDAGGVVEQYLYDAYGTPSVYDAQGNARPGGSAHDNRYLFKGAGAYEWLPVAGLYYARARFYLPAHGRWLQPDPIGQAGGLNLYAYCGNDPVNGIDPSGCDGLFDTIKNWIIKGVSDITGISSAMQGVVNSLTGNSSSGESPERIVVSGSDPRGGVDQSGYGSAQARLDRIEEQLSNADPNVSDGGLVYGRDTRAEFEAANKNAIRTIDNIAMALSGSLEGGEGQILREDAESLLRKEATQAAEGVAVQAIKDLGLTVPKNGDVLVGVIKGDQVLSGQLASEVGGHMNVLQSLGLSAAEREGIVGFSAGFHNGELIIRGSADLPGLSIQQAELLMAALRGQ